MTEPEWTKTIEAIRELSKVLEPLTPKQRRDTVEGLKEIYCLECGRYYFNCECSSIDRW